MCHAPPCVLQGWMLSCSEGMSLNHALNKLCVLACVRVLYESLQALPGPSS